MENTGDEPGIATALIMKAQSYCVVILSSYCPINAAKAENNQIWNKVIQATPSLGI